MPLQQSGLITLDDLHVEAGGTSGTLCSLNDPDIRSIIGASDSANQTIQQYYGASSITLAYDSTATVDLTGFQTSGTISLIGVTVGDILVLQIMTSQMNGTSSSYIPTVSGTWNTATSTTANWTSGNNLFSRILYRRVDSTSENSYTIQNGDSYPGYVAYILHRFTAGATSATVNDVETRHAVRGSGGGGTSNNHIINAGSASGPAIAIAQKTYYGYQASTSHPDYTGVPISTSPATASYSRYEHFSGGVTRTDVFVRAMSTGSNITVATGSDHPTAGVGYLYSHCYLTMS